MLEKYTSTLIVQIVRSVLPRTILVRTNYIIAQARVLSLGCRRTNKNRTQYANEQVCSNRTISSHLFLALRYSICIKYGIIHANSGVYTNAVRYIYI